MNLPQLSASYVKHSCFTHIVYVLSHNNKKKGVSLTLKWYPSAQTLYPQYSVWILWHFSPPIIQTLVWLFKIFLLIPSQHLKYLSFLILKNIWYSHKPICASAATIFFFLPPVPCKIYKMIDTILFIILKKF